MTQRRTKFFRRLKLLFTYPLELDLVVERIRADAAELQRLKTLDQLDLCHRHQQRCPGAEYAEKNCDYCKLLDEEHL